jgi:Tfp pilus assembly PilM family ATPase
VSDGQACQFTRVLDWGGRTLDESIAKALDLSPSEAQPIKLTVSLAERSIPAGLTSEQAERVRESVLRDVHGFARELVSSLQFYQSQPGSLGIGEIVLTGGTAELPGLATELSRLLGVRTRVGDPLAHVKVGKKVDQGLQFGSLTAAIGLGIEG